MVSDDTAQHVIAEAGKQVDKSLAEALAKANHASARATQAARATALVARRTASGQMAVVRPPVTEARPATSLK